MKFITSIFLSCLYIGVYAQQKAKIPHNEQKELKQILIQKDIQKDNLINNATNSSQKAELKMHNGIPMYDYNIKSLKNTGKVRCYTMENDALMRQKHPEMGSLDDFEKDLQKKIAKRKAIIAANIANNPNARIVNGIFYIPVVVHVIHNGEAVGVGSNISDAQIQDQIDVLNEDFRRKVGTNGFSSNPVSADCEIEYVLAKRTPTNAASNGIDRINRNTSGFSAPPYTTTYVDATIKPATSWNPDWYFNMWTASLSGGILGYAQFPPNSGLPGLDAEVGDNCTNGVGTATANTDGLVMTYDGFGRGLPILNYGDGRTATHEIGHGLGLRHLWGDVGTCGTVGDYCADTPECTNSNFSNPPGCPTLTQCGNVRQIENYMDYSGDLCMNIFTQDQKTRMRTVLESSPRRVNWQNSPALVAPVANYGAATNLFTPDGDYCFGNNITPQIELKNLGTSVLTTATISYQIDGGAVQTFAWTGSLAAQAVLNVNLPNIVAPALGAHTYRAFVTISNGVANTANTFSNDITANFEVVNGAAFPFSENFESNTFPPDKWQVTQSTGKDCYKWVEYTGITGLSGATSGVAFMNFFRYNAASNQKDELISPIIDIPVTATTAIVEFDVAYRQKTVGTADGLAVEISTDCGVTWTSIYSKTGATLSTVGSVSATQFVPTAAQWRKEQIDISTYANQKVRVRFISTNQFGNNLYIDNVKVKENKPDVSFVSATTTQAEAPTTVAVVGDCRRYTDVSIPVSISQASLVAIVVNVSVDAGASAISPADYELRTTSITFPAASAANQNVVVRVFDDVSIEATESLVLRLALAVSGMANITPNITNTLSIPDNDIVPASGSAGVTLLTENFDATAALPTGWATGNFLATPGVNLWRVGTQIVLAGTNSAYVSSAAGSATYQANSESDVVLRTPLIDATVSPTGDIEISFKFRCNGERSAGTNWDYGSLYYSTEAVPNTFNLIEGTTTTTPYQGVTTTTTRTFNLPTVLKGTKFYIGWGWYNDNSTRNNPAFVVDDVVIRTLTSGFAVEDALSGSTPNNQRYLGPNSTAYFYDNTTGKLMAKIENTSSHDYGCTSVVVDRVGTSSQMFVSAVTSEYLTNKTFRVVPTTNNTSGTYNARFYYTNAEILGWETATTKVRANALLAKTAGAISAATGATSYVVSSGTTTGTFGTDYWIEGSFATGFSGFGVGIPIVPLPIQLLDITAKKQTESVLIEWKTILETDVAYFEVEKSTNGKDFVTLGRKETILGNSNQEIRSYQMFDNSPSNGTNYYRLKTINKDDTKGNSNEFSKIISVNFEGKQTLSLSVYPVPAKNDVNSILNVAFFTPKEENVFIEIISLTGVRVAKYEQKAQAGQNKISLKTSNLAIGTYIIAIRNSQENTFRRFVIE